MRILIEPSIPNPRVVRQVAEILAYGGVIVYPTDTVYGLGCSISNKKGIEKIQQIKASKKPMSIMLSDFKNISKYAKVTNEAFRVLRKFWPGPYTFILPATRLVPRLLQSNRKAIGIRIPDNWFCQTLINETGEPIITTSVPMANERLHIDPLEIEQDLGHAVDAIIDCGLLADIPSTVISMETDTIQIIRKGLGPLDFLEQ